MKWLLSLLKTGADKKISSPKQELREAAQYVGKNFGRAIERLADR